MIITVKENTPENLLQELLSFIEKSDYRPRVVRGDQKTIIELIGQGKLDADDVLKFNIVEKVHRIQKPYKRISLEGDRRPSRIRVGDVEIGGEKLTMFIGPCAVETEEQTFQTAALIADYPVNDEIGGYILRGGAYKPRTSPYSFEGTGEAGLKILSAARKKFGFPIVTEIMSETDLEVCEKYTDIHQVGTRNFQNFRLLDALGTSRKPVLLKRGMSGTIEEFLLSAERIVARGNENVILCLRGIRTFNDAYRNDVDVADVVRLKQLTHLPVIFDPSHSTGNRNAIVPVSMGAIAMGADGLLVDLHINPETALVDGAQALWPKQGRSLIDSAILCKRAQMQYKRLQVDDRDARNG